MYKKLGNYESNYTKDFDEEFEKLRGDLNKVIDENNRNKFKVDELETKLGDVEIKNIGQSIRIDKLEDILFQTRNSLSMISYEYAIRNINRILIFINQFFEKEPYRSAILNAVISFFVVRLFS
jgi:hypothetical protein